MDVYMHQLTDVLDQVGVTRSQVTVGHEGVRIQFANPGALVRFWTQLPAALGNRVSVDELIEHSVTTSPASGDPVTSVRFPNVHVIDGNDVESDNGDGDTGRIVEALSARVDELERQVGRLIDLAQTRFGVQV